MACTYVRPPAAGLRPLFRLVALAEIRFRLLDGWRRFVPAVAARRRRMGLTKTVDDAA